MFAVLRRWWIPIVMVLVIVSSAALVARIRTYFGAVPVIVTPVIFGEDPDPHNPKRVTYEVSGSGTYADINYLDPDAIPRDLNNITLPWTMTVTATAASVAPILVAQSDGSTIRCRIVIDGKVKDERTSTGVNAQTFCLVKAG
ncbi:MmpS family transport accessory protein [Mycobacterium marinum]|uniref:MmpS family transport accessory protein n=1 Tax=Mycobacterium marinum TaxID=1781 RepID=UPI000B9737A1|nr:MmpS family transport accessory protein [Mycobacterium marinum]MDC8975792.1 MmpS family transport accessory protein [Mycobacterium marinum]MDC8985593.1 MmpS family transport accessory protein [Mycobacterium marinum]MDC8997469.1 MmpS family transport accessory protein [Mycobacterium marinum]MDC9002882.1 MmpS family transport accessory protein [Mycobacterium marinum]MDC9013621.1 MmpS family transport accessory protein [Mycobacterium marinum]